MWVVEESKEDVVLKYLFVIFILRENKYLFSLKVFIFCFFVCVLGEVWDILSFLKVLFFLEGNVYLY